MRRFLATCVLVLSGAWAFPQGVPSSSALKFSDSTWDFGTIQEQAGKVSHTFTFTNTASTPVVIEQVTTTCGCTTPTYSREPILPGRAGKIEVSYDPTNRPGPFRREITITSNNRLSQNKLTLAGTVIGRKRAPAEEFPSVVGDGLRLERLSAGLGYLPRGGSRSITIPYYNDSRSTLTLGVAYGRQTPYFRVSFAPSRLAPGARGTMTLTYDLSGQSVWGRLTNPFQITVNGTRAPEHLEAMGIAVEDFSSLTDQQRQEAPKAVLSTQYYHFKEQKIGNLLRHTFTLANTGLTPLVVRYLQPGAHMQVTLREGAVIAPGEELEFTATFRTESLPRGNALESCAIIVNDPERPLRELRLGAALIP